VTDTRNNYSVLGGLHSVTDTMLLAEIEIDEVHEALASGDAEAVTDEIGGLLFTVVNLARHAGFVGWKFLPMELKHRRTN